MSLFGPQIRAGFGGEQHFGPRLVVSDSVPVIPTQPTFAAESWWWLWNWNTAYNPADMLRVSDSAAVAATQNLDFLTTSPYAQDFGDVSNVAARVAPFKTNYWRDQNVFTFNPVIQATSANQPILQIVSSCNVAGVAEFTYRGQYNGKAYYNRIGYPSDAIGIYSIYWTVSGIGSWKRTNDVSMTVDESIDNVSFPWQAPEWAFINPTVGTQGGHLDFTGTQGMAGDYPLFSFAFSATGTIYVDWQPQSMAAGVQQVILESDVNSSQPRMIHISQTGNVLTCFISDGTAGTPLKNIKQITLTDYGRRLICFQFDTTQAAPANQTSLAVYPSVGSPVIGTVSGTSANCAGLIMGEVGTPNIGCRAAATAPSAGMTSYLWGMGANPVADSPSLMASTVAWWRYLMGSEPRMN